MAESDKATILSPLSLEGFPKFRFFFLHRLIEHDLWTFAELGIADLMVEYRLPITAVELSQMHGQN